jgi:replicative DNA helicase
MEENAKSNNFSGNQSRGENPENTRYSKKRLVKPSGGSTAYEHGKIQPQAIELEEAVLGAMMLEKHKLSEVIEILKPEVFYKEEHGRIFAAIQHLFGQVRPVDILTVTEELRKRGELELVGGPYYIATLTNRVVSSANIEWHARILIQKFIQRELIRISSDIIHDAYEDTTDVFDLLDKAEGSLFSVSESSLRKSFRTMDDIVREALEGIKERSMKEGGLQGVGSGFTELDRITAGWQKSDLVIIASRPGMGKTAFALTMARNIAVDFRKPVAVFSLEMASVQLVMRLISSETEIPGEKLKKGTLTDQEWERLYTKSANLIDAPLYIDDTPALTIFELRAKSRRLKAQHNIELIILDYLQLMQGASEARGNREQEISGISRSLKALAKELDVPILALSQLSREVEKRTVKKPILSDLRESGSIEQDADMVLFIYRPEYYKLEEDAEGSPSQGVAEVSIAKNRNGATKDIKLKFEGMYAKFSDLDVDYTFAENTISPNTAFDSPRIKVVPSRMNDEDGVE